MPQLDEHAEKFREAASRMSKDKAEERQLSSIPAQSRSENVSFDFFISALKIFAWVALIAGIIGSILMWTAIPDETRIPKGLRIQYIISAIALVIQGFVVWVLFYVVAMMAETLEDIRKKLTREK